MISWIGKPTHLASVQSIHYRGDIMAKKKDILEGHKDHEFKQFNDPEDVGKWNKKHEINDDLKKMMGKWYKK